MRPSRFLLSASILLASFAAAETASADACPSGGTLTITAAADSLTLSPVATTTFNFGEHTILTAAASGFTIATYVWTIDGPTIKDYNEDLGTKTAPAAAIPWSTTPLAAVDLSAASVGFYWVPAAGQLEPSNGPFSRNVSLTITKTGGGSCTVSTALNVERNETNITRQAHDFYTSNHRAATTTNPGFGHVTDEHIYWHQFVGGGPPDWLGFLAWHGEFLRRFDTWRQLFGYNKVTPWYPGRALPTGPQFDADAGLRQAYFPDNNRIPSYYTLTGDDNAFDPTFGPTHRRLANYATLDDFNASFEGSYHGQVHCNIGAHAGSFFGTAAGPGFGSMCNASSPKDAMFWRWHGFIDLMYRNYCALHPGACPVPSPADPSADPWMADNSSDISNNGTVPSPGTHWISPDVWNRRALVMTDPCVAPVDAYGDHDTTGGIVRNCGSDADHENPVAGVTNYLYGTLRNTRPSSPRVVYAEVGVYYALASSGLTYPGDFTFIPESRQFIAIHLEPGTTTSIGPIPWTPPPVPPSNDHYCLYLRVLSVQETPPTEPAGIDANVANSNSLAWRNIKVVAPGDVSPPSFFIVRNIGKRADRLGLRFLVPPELLKAPSNVRVTLDEALMRAFRAGEGKVDGLKADGKGGFLITSAKAQLAGLQMDPGQKGQVKVVVGPTKPSPRGHLDVTIQQVSREGVDGGVTIRLANKK
ncbi:MAG: tyrosinase family protein [Alphaproteobacteria bacterium]